MKSYFPLLNCIPGVCDLGSVESQPLLLSRCCLNWAIFYLNYCDIVQFICRHILPAITVCGKLFLLRNHKLGLGRYWVIVLTWYFEICLAKLIEYNYFFFVHLNCNILKPTTYGLSTQLILFVSSKASIWSVATSATNLNSFAKICTQQMQCIATEVFISLWWEY